MSFEKPTERKLGALSSRMEVLQKYLREREQQAVDARLSLKEQLQEQIAATEKQAAEFSALAVSGDYEGLKSKLSIFEMYAKVLDSDLDAKELSMISQDDFEEIAKVIKFLNKTPKNHTEKELQEIEEIRGEVVESLREMARKISDQFKRLGDRYKTQLEEFGDDAFLVAPIEGGEQNWAEKVIQIRKDFIRESDPKVSYGEKYQKRGSPEMPKHTLNTVYLNDVFNAYIDVVEKTVSDPVEREKCLNELLQPGSVVEVIDGNKSFDMTLAVEHLRYQLLALDLSEKKVVGTPYLNGNDFVQNLFDRRLFTRNVLTQIAAVPKYKEFFVNTTHGIRLREEFPVDVPGVTDDQVKILENIKGMGVSSAARGSDIKKALGVAEGENVDYLALAIIKNSESAFFSGDVMQDEQVLKRVEYLRNAVLHPNDVGDAAEQLLDNKGFVSIKTVGEGQLLAGRIRDVAADKLVSMRKRLDEAQVNSDENAKQLKAQLTAAQRKAAALEEDGEYLKKQVSGADSLAEQHRNRADAVRKLLGDKDAELTQDKAARKALEKKLEVLKAAVVEASKTKIGLMGGQKTFDDVMKNLQGLL